MAFFNDYDAKVIKKAEEYSNDSADKVAAGNTKYDGGKSPIYRGGLAYFPVAISAVATVSAFGASKYSWNGWRGVDDGINRYTDALVRHLAYEAEGESVDPDSGLIHAAHTAWNALARLELIIEQQKNQTKAAIKYANVPGQLIPDPLIILK